MTREDELLLAANDYIGHAEEIDEGIEVSMRRAAFCDGANYEHLRLSAAMQWREITPDNVDEVYAIPEERLAIAFRYDEHKAVYMMCSEMNSTRNTMAKLGGYYYLELPEMK